MILESNICGAIDNNFAELIHTIITIIKFGVPVLLIIFGMLDLAKGVIASKEDEIKKGQQIFIKRIISAILVFFAVAIVQLVVGLADDKDSQNTSEAWECANLIINGKTHEENNDLTNPNNSNNNGDSIFYKTSTGLECYSERAKREYEICSKNNSKENNTNVIVCGTIFRNYCDYEGTILWNTNSKYEDEIVNELEWYSSPITENYKQVYYDCVKSGLDKEMCKGFFSGLYIKR